ncbi:MAG TPA: 5-formyltetrahydrofolate cyclo-ligase [Polyangiales bacterium]
MRSPNVEASPGEVAHLQAAMKSELRKRMRSVRGVLPIEACAVRSQRACAALLSLPQYARASTVLAYVAMRKELDPRELVVHALAAGKRVALPRIDGETLSLHAYQPDDELETNAFGLQEPLASAPRIDAQQVELVLVPALALDPRGYRIGYGGGFYDRVLPLLLNAYKVGLAYDFQLISEAPVDAHDVPVDAVITDARCLVAVR